jgi:HEAT repeat protein
VRASALTALGRLGSLSAQDVTLGLADPAPEVRRRACDVAGQTRLRAAAVPLVAALCDAVPEVAEAACAALGELGSPTPDVVVALARTTVEHPSALCREAAVAALGAGADPEALPAVLAACGDKPAVRRRAVTALAAFEGQEVEAALGRALSDPDWQVRQVAEDLVGRRAL